MGFLCIRLDFLVKVVVLVEGFWWIYIFDSFGFFGGVCDCIEGCEWWWLWLWVFGFAISGGGFWVCHWWWWSWIWVYEFHILCVESHG